MKKSKYKAKKKSKNNTNQNAKNKYSLKRFPIRTDTIHIILYACTLLVTVLGVLSSIYFSHPNPQYFTWTLFLFFIFVEISFCLYWFTKRSKSKFIILSVFSLLFIITLLAALILPLWLIKKPPLPTFTDSINNKLEPVFSLGTSGMSFSDVNVPFIIGGFEPFKPHIEKDKLFVDVEIFSKTGFPPIKIINNQLYNLPADWDRNSNDVALEIVNENLQPMYQLVYEKPFKLSIKGVFPNPSGVIIADDIRGVSLVSYSMLQKFPTQFKLKRIFKYPSWRYPGEYDEKY
ncbi:MAG: hypothetical protein CV087_10325 [Candidatus Brocadia sp. WS118]|nr:MAG: hypothetical protein CV087_10325 [Candidatus Brocadia sp. WS118]